MKSTYILTLVLICGLGATQADATDGRLMTDAEYKSLLGEVDSKLPVWEAALKKIDPAKSTVSYSVGEEIVKYRDVGLMEIGYARQFAAKQRVKRSVSGELALEGFLRGIHDSLDSMIVTDISAGVSISSALDAFAPQIRDLEMSLANDVTARIELLEKGTCP
jgi:hypothetical protein